MMEYVSFIIEFMIRVNNYLYIVIEQYVQGSIIKIRYLLAYEQKFFFGKNDSQAIKELQGSRVRKIVKINDEEQE